MPWDRFVESLYGYRYIEKTTTGPAWGFPNTTDWGLNASGSLGDGDLVTYAASVVNGAGYKNPTRTKDVDFEGPYRREARGLADAGVRASYSGHPRSNQTPATRTFPATTATRLDFVTGREITAGFRVGAEYFDAKNYKTVKDAASAAFGNLGDRHGLGRPCQSATRRERVFSGWASYAFDAQWSVFGALRREAKLSKDVAPDLKDKYLNIGLALQAD